MENLARDGLSQKRKPVFLRAARACGGGRRAVRAVAAATSLPVALAWHPWSVPPSQRCAWVGGPSEGHGSAMEGVDISQFSEEEQRILRNVFARAQDEEERDKIKFRSVQFTPPLSSLPRSLSLSLSLSLCLSFTTRLFTLSLSSRIPSPSCGTHPLSQFGMESE
ncbi:hypothetical protein CEXT_684841 [Caerostris extrusa]|uniref:RabBD domain-containing protein n=1 Tax=Caerostris extrusa TaxID=172846 RepID=A0AAV4NVZ7_CAEEX|nr:hypothetical protein CEXT_684841 [Caerostris extrusa]